jgi:A/G-specific adenine glycosylase
MSLAELQSLALDWYAAYGRDLAFRRTADPWAILVSEVMAQQTQAARAAEAWTRFMDEFPTPGALASASPASVIRAWRGLGYNRRALAIHRAASAIVDEHDGLVPDSLEALLRLPGIGPYTARAVLAIAFGRPVAALDVNIRRVVARASLGGDLPDRDLQPAADALVPPGRAADWTHALMDIGAAFCRAREPRCHACPLARACGFASQSRPVNAAVVRARTRTVRFEDTTRWLRGRILDRLRDDTDWVTFAGPIGSHGTDAVAAALSNLAREGMIELDAPRARLVA